METFAQLGIPFPLYEAPVKEASDYAGKTTCGVCGKHDQPCFILNIGCALMVSCPKCNELNGLDANDRQDTSCRSCGNEIKFTTPSNDDGVHICYSCLREGKGAITKDTEFGMVSWEQAIEGRTHGVPGLQTSEFETVTTDPDGEWIGVILPQEHLFELLRTPTFVTWQGEVWLFCCKKPMTYIGEWKSVAASLGQTEAKNMFDQLMPEDSESSTWVWEGVSSASDSVCLYVFQCKDCGNHRANYDMD